MDDRIISAKIKEELEIGLNTVHEILNSLNMKLNINKCELLIENEKKLTDLLTNTSKSQNKS